MAVLNHHIVRARDNEATARFFAETLGFEPPTRLGEFAVLQVSKDTTLDFVNVDGDIHQLHYAFLVTEEEFDEILERLGRRNAAYWSDPFRQDPGRINHWDDGRGVVDLDAGRCIVINCLAHQRRSRASCAWVVIMMVKR